MDFGKARYRSRVISCSKDYGEATGDSFYRATGDSSTILTNEVLRSEILLPDERLESFTLEREQKRGNRVGSHQSAEEDRADLEGEDEQEEQNSQAQVPTTRRKPPPHIIFKERRIQEPIEKTPPQKSLLVESELALKEFREQLDLRSTNNGEQRSEDECAEEVENFQDFECETPQKHVSSHHQVFHLNIPKSSARQATSGISRRMRSRADLSANRQLDHSQPIEVGLSFEGVNRVLQLDHIQMANLTKGNKGVLHLTINLGDYLESHTNQKKTTDASSSTEFLERGCSTENKQRIEKEKAMNGDLSIFFFSTACFMVYFAIRSFKFI